LTIYGGGLIESKQLQQPHDVLQLHIAGGEGAGGGAGGGGGGEFLDFKRGTLNVVSSYLAISYSSE
jgi:hypothetical protein